MKFFLVGLLFGCVVLTSVLGAAVTAEVKAKVAGLDKTLKYAVVGMKKAGKPVPAIAKEIKKKLGDGNHVQLVHGILEESSAELCRPATPAIKKKVADIDPAVKFSVVGMKVQGMPVHQIADKIKPKVEHSGDHQHIVHGILEESSGKSPCTNAATGAVQLNANGVPENANVAGVKVPAGGSKGKKGGKGGKRNKKKGKK